ncbi:P-loop containing nucleoside triphosphate hydrolase protein [Trametes gibbosa]|nr:P-loop containing nucleoside triphosphate hydrolase protein [Trametes gibbosa]
MDASQILQTVLSAIQAGEMNMTVSPSQQGALGAATNATTSGAEAPSGPPGFTQLLIMLFSMSAVRDWAKLLLIGAVLEGCRRLLTRSWESIDDFFWVTATFELPDDTADWLLYWMSQHKIFHTARRIDITSFYFGFDNVVDEFGDEGEKVSFYPSMDRKYTLWYRGRYITIKREQRTNGFRRPSEILTLRILTRDTQVLRNFLLEARGSYKVAAEQFISVYVTESTDRWTLVANQQKRPASSVILDPGVFELVLADARDFIKSKKWYACRGIPFRRGYLLYGAPGAGKTSMIHSIAGELGLNVYILSLTIMALDDNSLKSLIARLPERCILLIEDIDAAFHRGMKRNIADPEQQQRQHPQQRQAQRGPTSGKEDVPPGDLGKDKAQEALLNGVTLSGLLNALDGIAAQEGRILFATTNDYSALDPALLRPGRLDLHVAFELASAYQAREIFARFYTPDESEGTAPAAAAVSDAGEGNEKDDSGYSSANFTQTEDSDGAAEVPLDAPSVMTPIPPASPPRLPKSVHSVCASMVHGADCAPWQMSAKHLAALAERFAEIVPARAFSMATLQGYLMAYKIRPLEAVADAPAWVEKRMREKDAVAGMRRDLSQGLGAPRPDAAAPQ